MGTMLIGLVFYGQTLQFAGDRPLTKLEAAVQAGPRIHEVNKAAARPGEQPHAYASPGREKHGKPPPPGQSKRP